VGVERAVALLESPPAELDAERGYLDLLGSESFARKSLSQALMNNPVVPALYESLWRPLFGRIVAGRLGAGPIQEYSLIRELLATGPGDVVLDVACGPGNVTRSLARTVGARGLVVGLDASADMLGRAVKDTPGTLGRGPYDNVEYVRADAVRLPFRSATFDSVCCWAALHMFDEPFRALGHMVRVLAPGGRLAILTSHRRHADPYRTVDNVLGAVTGIRMFADDAVTRALRGNGLVDVERRLLGLTQIVSAHKQAEPPAAAPRPAAP
jgi:SAM-dependent methyltransferase